MRRSTLPGLAITGVVLLACYALSVELGTLTHLLRAADRVSPSPSKRMRSTMCRSGAIDLLGGGVVLRRALCVVANEVVNHHETRVGSGWDHR